MYRKENSHSSSLGRVALAAAFLRAGLVDLGITSIADAFRPRVTDMTVLEGLDGEPPNVRLVMTPEGDH